MVKTAIEFRNGVFLDDKKIEEITEEMFSVMRKELPAEALCAEVIEFIFDEAKSRIQLKPLAL